IRDGHVTGVQTCALPISLTLLSTAQARGHQGSGETSRRRSLIDPAGTRRVLLWRPRPRASSLPPHSFVGPPPTLPPAESAAASRSEERRVGKECRSRGAT